MLKNCENKKDIKYSLFGFIIHKGNNLHKGHYISIVKRDKKWYLCNDSEITEMKASLSNEYIFFDKIDMDETNRNGYLFFYRKINS